MNDPVVLQLRQVVTAHGAALLQNPAQLEQLLSTSAASFPGKVKALLILLDKQAVAFLTNWSKDARPNKGSYEQVREQVASKFEKAKLLNASAAAWGLDAWAAVLELRGVAAPSATPAPEARAAAGLALAEPEGTPPLIKPPAPAPAASAASPTAVLAKAAGNTANPYAPPAAPVSDPAQEADESAFIPAGRAVPAGRGGSWFAQGWGMFKASPLIWIVNFLVFMLVLIAIELVPLIGGIVGALLTPVLGAGVMIGAHAVQHGEPLEVGHLFAGFRDRTGPLILVGVLYTIGTAVIVLAIMLLAGVSLLGAIAGGGKAAMGLGMSLAILLGVAISIPLMMAYWLALALVALNGYTAIDAIKTSFLACLKNILPFLVYVLVGLVLAVIATIPALLGWFVLAPVGMASIYASYRDIFYDE